MKRWSKEWWIILISIVALTYCIYAIVYEVYQLQGKAFIFRLLTLIGVYVFLYIVLVVVWYFIYRKKQNKFSGLLDEGRTEEFVAAVEKELEKTDGGVWHNACKIDLAVCYSRLNQNEKALSILEEVSCKSFKKELKALYALNLFWVYYELGQKDKAMEVYDANEKYFTLIRKGTKYSGNIAIIDMYAAIEKGQYEGLEEKLKRTRDTWHNPQFQEDYERIEELLLKQRA